MQYGPSDSTSTEDAEYYFQELRAQRLRAKLLFHCYLSDDDGPDEADDDYFDYYAEDCAS